LALVDKMTVATDWHAIRLLEQLLGLVEIGHVAYTNVGKLVVSMACIGAVSIDLPGNCGARRGLDLYIGW
jgi:hypothetical protein